MYIITTGEITKDRDNVDYEVYGSLGEAQARVIQWRKDYDDMFPGEAPLPLYIYKVEAKPFRHGGK